MPDETTPITTPEQRLAAMELALSALIARVSYIEQRLRIAPRLEREAAPAPVTSPRSIDMPPEMAARAWPTPAAPPAPAEAPVAPMAPPLVRSGADLEALVGRYGAIGFALVALLAGVGTFISWAVRRGYLGPTVRVAAGFALAAALAVAGVRLRASRRTFGNALLACALSVTFTALWGAGPRLHLVPSWVALGLAAVASAALAWLALREQEDTLFTFGIAGATIAPFLFGEREGSTLALAAYGALVHVAAARALGPRPWRVALGVVLWLVPLYLYAMLDARGSESLAGPAGWAAPMLALGLWIAALIAAPLHAPRFARWGALALLVAGPKLDESSAAIGIALVLIATIGVQGLLALARSRGFDDASTDTSRVQLLPIVTRAAVSPVLFDACILPALGLLAVVFATPRSWTRALSGGELSHVATAGVFWGLVWALGAARFAHRSRRRGAPAHASAWMMTTVVAMVVACVCLADYGPVAATSLALAAMFVLASWWHSTGTDDALRGGFALLGLAVLFAGNGLLSLATRDVYATPFSTRYSAVAALVVAGAIGLRALMVSASRPFAGVEDPSLVRLLGVLTGIGAFLWGLTELQHAWSHDVSSLLVTAYFGVTGALAIRVGFWRRIGGLRHLGLVLGAICALRTFGMASGIAQLGLRITVYFIAAAVGLTIGWLYTGSGERRG